MRQEQEALRLAQIAKEEAAKVEAQKKQGREKHKRRQQRSPAKDDDDALSLAEDLNLGRIGRDHSSDSDLVESESDAEIDERDLSATQLAKNRKRKKARDEKRVY